MIPFSMAEVVVKMNRSKLAPTVGGVALVITLCLLPAAPTRADFHLWQIVEVYSNAAGTVQFIELATNSDGQHRLENHTLTSSDGSQNPQIFTYPSDLPSSATGGMRFLMGTAGLADLQQGVSPDYEIPDGFIDPENGTTLDFAGVDLFDLDGLPLDGVSSLDSVGAIHAATPENFAGELGVVPEPPSGLAGCVVLISLVGITGWRSKSRAGPPNSTNRGR